MNKEIYYEFRETQFDMIQKRNRLIEERERKNKSNRSYPIYTPVTLEKCGVYQRTLKPKR